MKRTKKNTPKRSQRWSIGLYRNERGLLSTVYVTVDGVPVPYQRKQMKGAKVLFHAVYTGITYSQARQRLLKESRLSDRPVAKKAATKKPADKEEHLKAA